MRNKPGDKIWLKEPMLPGPYVVIPQGTEEYFAKNFLKMTHVFETKLRVEWGHSTWAIGPLGEPVMVASDFDTTD